MKEGYPALKSFYFEHWLPRWQDRCCRTSPELCSNDLSWILISASCG